MKINMIDNVPRVMEKLFVIKVINTSEAELRKWYRTRGGELFVVRRSTDVVGYSTVGHIDDECSIGFIEEYFCKVLTEFECEDDY